MSPVVKATVADEFKGAVGDLLVGFHGDRSGVMVIEQITDASTAALIVGRWLAQGVVYSEAQVELWHANGYEHVIWYEQGRRSQP